MSGNVTVSGELSLSERGTRLAEMNEFAPGLYMPVSLHFLFLVTANGIRLINLGYDRLHSAETLQKSMHKYMLYTSSRL